MTWTFKKTLVILISGKAGSGKDHVGNLLYELFNDEYKYFIYKVSFAKKLKECAIKYFGWDLNKNTSGRRLLQQLGSIGREYNKDIWIKSSLLDVYNKTGGLPPNCLIYSDWRFPNEASYFESRPELFNTYKIRVDASLSKQVLAGTPEGEDSSEVSLPESCEPVAGCYYDMIIYNDFDPENMNITCKNLFELIVKERLT